MHPIKLTLQYDGSGFSGYEIQPGKRTVRGELEQAFLKLYKISVKFASSSRTDAGVHALGNVISYEPPAEIPTEKLPIALNALLPDDLRVVKAEAKPKGFNARFDAKSKEYQYLIFNGQILPPHLRLIAWQVKPKLNLSAMKRAAKYLVGKHDFSSFCAAGGDDTDYVRIIQKLVISHSSLVIWKESRAQKTDSRAQGLIRFTVIGNGFLYKMVRNIVGTLVDVGLGRTSADQFKNILEARDRRLAGRTAPGRGLCLVRVDF